MIHKWIVGASASTFFKKMGLFSQIIRVNINQGIVQIKEYLFTIKPKSEWSISRLLVLRGLSIQLRYGHMALILWTDFWADFSETIEISTGSEINEDLYDGVWISLGTPVGGLKWVQRISTITVVVYSAGLFYSTLFKNSDDTTRYNSGS